VYTGRVLLVADILQRGNLSLLIVYFYNLMVNNSFNYEYARTFDMALVYILVCNHPDYASEITNMGPSDLMSYLWNSTSPEDLVKLVDKYILDN